MRGKKDKTRLPEGHDEQAIRRLRQEHSPRQLRVPVKMHERVACWIHHAPVTGLFLTIPQRRRYILRDLIQNGIDFRLKIASFNRTSL